MRRLRILNALAALAALLAAEGCVQPPLMVQVETRIRADGRCERTIWQPETDLLPALARSPEWRARWDRIEPLAFPPALGDVDQHPRQAYFRAAGSFSDLAAIPEHYERAAPSAKGAGSSVLRCDLERRDFGFVVQYRWREAVTNIVTPEGFSRARDELLERGLPMLAEAVGFVYGPDFDVSRLQGYLRREGRALVEKASDAYFEIRSRHLGEEDAFIEYAKAAREIGLDLFDGSGSLARPQDVNARMDAFVRHRVALGIRHRDGSRLTAKELDSILSPPADSPYQSRAQEYARTHKAALEALVGPALRMTGLYETTWFFPMLQAPPIHFAVAVRLPGEVVQTNGKQDGKGGVSWRFTGADLYPSGFTMTVRSLAIDEEAQRLALGRLVLTDRRKAEELAAILDGCEPLRALVLRVRETKDAGLLKSHVAGSAEERARLERLRRLLEVAE